MVRVFCSLVLGITLLVLSACSGGGGGLGEVMEQPHEQTPQMQDQDAIPAAAPGMPNLPDDALVDPAEILARRGSWAEIATLTGTLA